MPKLDPRLVGECATWLSIVSQLFSTRMSQLLKPYGMTLGQFSILHHIARQKLKGGARISDISMAVEVGQPAVTKAVGKFEIMGLVELVGSTEDKRSKFVVAKSASRELLDDIRMGIGPELSQIFSAIEESRIDAFVTDLKGLANWLDTNRN